MNKQLRSNFVAFIICHGKPDDCKTWKSLNKCGYTGPRYILVDDKDNTIEQYKHNFGENNVLVFSKEFMLQYFDKMDNWSFDKCIVYARNACFYFANKLGYKYFVELDDDYVDFAYRQEVDGQLTRRRCYQLDLVFEAFLKMLDVSPKINTVALAQPGDLIGGKGSSTAKNGYKRKAMNSFICDVEKPLSFDGTLNEDVNAYVTSQIRGNLCLTFSGCMIDQPETQSGGGMTDIYLQTNTYIKSFYSVIKNPSVVKISVFRSVYPRIHHKVFAEIGYPKVISSRFKIKEAN